MDDRSGFGTRACAGPLDGSRGLINPRAVRRGRISILAAVLGAGLACGPSEAPRVELPVLIDGSELGPATNDLGWTVELTQARMVIEELRFTTAGEVHEGRGAGEGAQLLSHLSAQLGSLLLPRAWAHPGHFQDGEIIGELAGRYAIDFATEDGRELGRATLIAGDYAALAFGLGRGDAQLGLESDDPLLGHSALLRGVASGEREGQPFELEFEFVVDSPLDREITGIPFDASVDEGTQGAIGLRLYGVDPIEGDTLFAGIDFAALADFATEGEPLRIADPDTVEQDPLLDETYYALRRELQAHDLFEATLE